MSTVRTLECVVCFILLSASALELVSALSDSPCRNVVHVKNGSSVAFYCDLNCTSENSTAWFYYKNSSDAIPTLLHNGHSPHPSWSSWGITVNYNQTAVHSVLKIENVTINNTGMYECSTNADNEDGCKMHFCLTADEEKKRFDYTTDRSELTYNTAILNSAAADKQRLMLYGICGGCLALTVVVALTAVCYLKKSKDRLLSSDVYENRGTCRPDLLSLRNLAEQRQDKETVEGIEMSDEGRGHGHVINNGDLYAEVIPPSQRVPVQHISAAAAAVTAADELQPSMSGAILTLTNGSEEVEVSQYAEVVVMKSDKSKEPMRRLRPRGPPPIYADIVHQTSTGQQQSAATCQLPV